MDKYKEDTDKDSANESFFNALPKEVFDSKECPVCCDRKILQTINDVGIYKLNSLKLLFSQL